MIALLYAPFAVAGLLAVATLIAAIGPTRRFAAAHAMPDRDDPTDGPDAADLHGRAWSEAEAAIRG